jgi:hypothetical protein
VRKQAWKKALESLDSKEIVSVETLTSNGGKNSKFRIETSGGCRKRLNWVLSCTILGLSRCSSEAT